MDVPTGAKGLDEVLDRLVFAVQRDDEDGVVTARAAIGLAVRHLVREVEELEELIRHQPKESVVH
jgi:hypothetical protein